MILIGQYDSSFVRRVGIALTIYRIAFEHRPWSVFGDADKVANYNSLMRVPTFVLDDGEVLVDSPSIIDHIDSLVPEDRRLMPATGVQRLTTMRVTALATGLADKGVALFYELRLHPKPSDYFVERCRKQIIQTLRALEMACRDTQGGFGFGEQLSHADIAVACAVRHVAEAHPGLIELPAYPKLERHCASMEDSPVFREISQPFIPPA